MRVIVAPNDYALEKDEISLFLAGGITNCDDWQSDIIEKLKICDTQHLTVFNPRRENFPIHDKMEGPKQILWEFRALEICYIFSMYFASGESDQPICMYELGRNIVKMQIKYPIDWKDRIVISVEDGYKRKIDVLTQVRLACSDLRINIDNDIEAIRTLHTQYIMQSYFKLLNRSIK